MQKNGIKFRTYREETSRYVINTSVYRMKRQKWEREEKKTASFNKVAFQRHIRPEDI